MAFGRPCLLKFSTLVGVLAFLTTGVRAPELKAEDRVPVLLEPSHPKDAQFVLWLTAP